MKRKIETNPNKQNETSAGDFISREKDLLFILKFSFLLFVKHVCSHIYFCGRLVYLIFVCICAAVVFSIICFNFVANHYKWLRMHAIIVQFEPFSFNSTYMYICSKMNTIDYSLLITFTSAHLSSLSFSFSIHANHTLARSFIIWNCIN